MIKGHTALEVEQAYTRAFELCQQVGESLQLFSTLAGLWRFYFARPRLLTARDLGEQCFALAQCLQDSVSLQESHQMLGSTLFFLGEFTLALTHLEQGIALYDPVQSHSRAFSRATDSGVVCLSRAARTLWALGYPDRALAKSHEALTLAQELAHTYSLGFALSYASALHQSRREAQLTQNLAEATIALSREQEFVVWLGGATMRRGWALAEQGAVEEGLQQLHQGLAICQTVQTELGLPQQFAGLAEAYSRGGHPEEGLRVLDEALEAAQKNTERYYEVELYRLKGELLLQKAARKRSTSTTSSGTSIVAETKEEGTMHGLILRTEAETCFRQALDVARRQQAKSLELRVVMSLSRLWKQEGKRTEARQMLTEIYDWFTEGFDTPDLQEAKALLEALI
jgi:predicted ATPase